MDTMHTIDTVKNTQNTAKTDEGNNDYHYLESGLDNIWLQGGVTEHNTPEGQAVSITNIDELHHMIAMHIIEDPSLMTGLEFRFIRIELDLSQRSVARLLKTEEKNVQRWETGKSALPGPAGVALAQYYQGKHKHSEFAELMDRIAELDRELTEIRLFSAQGDHWVAAA